MHYRDTTITVEDILIKTSGIINVHVSIHNMLLIIAVKRVTRHDDDRQHETTDSSRIFLINTSN